MKAYTEICDHFGLPPKSLFLVWTIGFLGCFVGALLGALERYQEFTLIFMSLGLVPHFYVGIHAAGTRSERAGKIMLSALLLFVFVFFPGGGLGALLGLWLK
jgi:hypothetical protein